MACHQMQPARGSGGSFETIVHEGSVHQVVALYNSRCRNLAVVLLRRRLPVVTWQAFYFFQSPKTCAVADVQPWRTLT